MPIKGDDIAGVTAAASLDHHGVDVLIDGQLESVRAMIHRDIEVIDPSSGVSTYMDAVEVLRAYLPTHAHGLSLTVVATGQVFKLQKTLKDDGYLKLIQVTK